MTVRKEGDISVQRPESGQETVGAFGNLPGSFPARTPIAKEIPVRAPFANIHGTQSFVVAVIPLREVRVDLGDSAESGQLTSPPRSLSRAGQHLSKLDVPEARSKLLRPLLAALGQWNVCATGMLAGERPLGFAVSNKIKAREHVPRYYLVVPHFQNRIGGSPDAAGETVGLVLQAESDNFPPLCDSQPASEKNSIILRKQRAAGWPPRSGNWRASSRRGKRRSIFGAVWQRFMGASPKKSLALDTNLLLDLAGE